MRTTRQPYTLLFETPAGDPGRWTQYHESMEAASDAFTRALAAEYPDGQGGTVARRRAVRNGSSEPRRLECCCCGDDAGVFYQHWNRDDGYGICAKCVAWLRGRGESEDEIRDLYGVEGVNFATAGGAS